MSVIILIVGLYEVYDYACLCLNNMLCYPFKRDSLLFLLHDWIDRWGLDRSDQHGRLQILLPWER